MRFRAERANKARPHRIRRAVHHDRPSGLAQLVEHRLQRNRGLLAQRDGNLRRRLGDRFRGHSLCYTLARPLRAASYRCPASCCACSCRSHRFCSSFAVWLRRECSLSAAQNVSISGFAEQTLKPVASSTFDARQCVCRCACCDASSCPTSETPMAFAGDCP